MADTGVPSSWVQSALTGIVSIITVLVGFIARHAHREVDQIRTRLSLLEERHNEYVTETSQWRENMGIAVARLPTRSELTQVTASVEHARNELGAQIEGARRDIRENLMDFHRILTAAAGRGQAD
jgi:hypothetical protein